MTDLEKLTENLLVHMRANFDETELKLIDLSLIDGDLAQRVRDVVYAAYLDTFYRSLAEDDIPLLNDAWTDVRKKGLATCH